MTAPDITIPPEALEVAELAYTEALSNGEDPIRAACLAMLKHWPGMKLEHLSGWVMDGPDLPYVEEVASIILPLPTESTNAEA